LRELRTFIGLDLQLHRRFDERRSNSARTIRVPVSGVNTATEAGRNIRAWPPETSYTPPPNPMDGGRFRRRRFRIPPADMFVSASTDLIVTLACLAASLCFGAYLIWLERQPTEPGRPRLLPTTPLLLICALVLILALAHMVTIVTGVPHTGRLG